MIGGEDERVIRPEQRQKAREPPVERRGCSGITLHIVAVAIEHIKINKIDKAQAMKILIHKRLRLLHPVCVALGWNCPGNAAPGKNIVDFSHGDGIKALLL